MARWPAGVVSEHNAPIEPSTDRGRLAFVFAMPMEAKPFVKQLSLTKAPVGDRAGYVGTLGDRDVVAVVTGMGTVLARDGVQGLLDAVRVERVVVVGITGALEDETPIGTLVRPAVVVDGATGSEHRPTPLGAERAVGVLWTSDSLTTDPAVLADLRSRGVVALDMETAAVAELCEQRGIPWSVVRVISDRATDGNVDDEVFHLAHQDGTPDPRAVLRFVVRHPVRVVRLARVARGALRATRVVADAAIRACAPGG